MSTLKEFSMYMVGQERLQVINETSMKKCNIVHMRKKIYHSLCMKMMLDLEKKLLKK